MHKGVGLKMIANNTEPFESIHSGHSGELLWDEHILMGLQSDYDMQTTKNDKSFAARLRNVRKLVAAF